MTNVGTSTHREWLRSQLEKAGRGARKRLAQHLGVSPNAITRMLNTDPGKEARDIRAAEMDQMRAFFREIEDTTLVDGVVGPVPLSPLRVPYGGLVGAGGFLPVEYFDQDAGDHHVPETVIAHPSYANVAQSAWHVRGSSMDRAGIVDGMWIVAANYLDYIDKIGELANGNYVIVERSRAGGSELEMTVKEVQFSRRGMRLIPRSSDPKYQELFVPLDFEADSDEEQIRILAVVLWSGHDHDPRSRQRS